MQTIRNETLEFPETGLVRFCGDNNNGKSVLVKAFWKIVQCALNIKEERLALINYESESAQFVAVLYNGKVLSVNIARRSDETYYQLAVPGKTPVRRYIADKNLPSLIDEFGIHYDEKRDVSLNIYNTYDPLIFVTTAGPLNLDLYNSAANDPKAERAAQSIDETIKDLEAYREKIAMSSASWQAKMSAYHIYDVEKEEKQQARYTYILNSIENLNPVMLPKLSAVIDISAVEYLDTSGAMLNVNLEHVNAIKKLTAVDVLSLIPDLTNISTRVGEYIEIVEALRTQVCPVCKRRFEDDEC